MDTLSEVYLLYCDICGYKFIEQDKPKQEATCPSCQSVLKWRHTWVKETVRQNFRIIH